MDTITNIVLHTVAQLSAVPQEQIFPADTLSSLGMHSMKKVELIVVLEDALSVTFAVEDLSPENLTTVKDIISLAERYTGR